MSARDEYVWATRQPGVWEQMCDEIDRLRSQVTAVNAALDQYRASHSPFSEPDAFVAAVAKAVGR